jgi:hypothetical protein
MSFVRHFPATTLLLFLGGCALLKSDGEHAELDLPWSRDDSQEEAAGTTAVLKVARVEANVVRRPANDARIRTLVWEDLDESGPMSPEERQRLNSSGFRVGVAGSSAPWALQSLARDATQAAVAGSSGASNETFTGSFEVPVGPAFSVFERGVTRLEVQKQIDSSLIPLESIPQLAGLRERNHLRCVMQVTVEELDQGWALLKVQPEIHSGASTLRLSVAGSSDQLPVRQNVYPLYEQQFTLKLHRGEVAVIGRYGTNEWNPGRLFFQPESGSAATESLLLIRLSGVDEARGTSDMSVSVGKKYAW